MRPSVHPLRLVLLTALVLLGAVTAASAATYTVSNTADAPAVSPGEGCATAPGSAAGGACTLRSAVQAADAAGGNDTIDLAPGDYKLTISPSDQSGADPSTGDLDITDTTGTVTITGTGGASSTTVDANFLDRAFNVATNADLSLSGVTVVDGRPGGIGVASTCPSPPANETDGGGILNNGTLALTGDVITGNVTAGNGAGVADDSEGNNLTISGTTISNNTTCAWGSGNGHDGGGLYSNTAGTVTVDHSTITGNNTVSNSGTSSVTGGAGGGIAFETGGGGTLDLTNSTVAGNTGLVGGGVFSEGGEGPVTANFVADTLSANKAPNQPDIPAFNGIGGGILTEFGNLSMVNSTVTGNSSGGGGGIAGVSANSTISFSTIDANSATNTTSNTGGNLQALNPDPFTLDNTIVSGGIAPAGANTNCGSDLPGQFTSGGHNIFDDTTDGGSQCGAGAGTQDLITSPNLSPLANNGGPTQTQALQSTSPAINAAAANSVCAAETSSVDQRGVSRPQGPACDIGAYEAEIDLALKSSVSPGSVNVGGKLTFTDTITNNGPAPATNVVFQDPAAASYTITSASSSEGSCSHTSSNVTCQIGSLPVGAAVTVTIVVTGNTPGTVTLHSSVSGGETDTDLANNVATAAATVSSEADLALTKKASVKHVIIGKKVTFTLKVTNRGPDTDTGVTVTDRVPRGLKVDSVKTSRGRCTGKPKITCKLGTMSNGAKATITIKTTATKLGKIVNTGTVTGQLHDPNLKNNTSKASVKVNPVPCRENLIFSTGWDPTGHVGTVKVYLDGRHIGTRHGYNIRRVKIKPPPPKGIHSVTVMFIINPFATVDVTRSYVNCMSGATQYEYPPQTNPGAS